MTRQHDGRLWYLALGPDPGPFSSRSHNPCPFQPPTITFCVESTHAMSCLCDYSVALPTYNRKTTSRHAGTRTEALQPHCSPAASSPSTASKQRRSSAPSILLRRPALYLFASLSPSTPAPALPLTLQANDGNESCVSTPLLISPFERRTFCSMRTSLRTETEARSPAGQPQPSRRCLTLVYR
ncbi:hypothetical protein BC835DRAFT_995202 [Cytidiella melzeri]|nr:hypothetical protein BC835DRAFT_995202 [Cytidiella melzeri]